MPLAATKVLNAKCRFCTFEKFPYACVAFTALFILFKPDFCAQNPGEYDWWTEIHHWDGHTSWVQYMTISTSINNALPVPEIKTGQLSDEAQLEQLAGYQFSRDKNKGTSFSRVYVPLHSNKVGLELCRPAWILPNRHRHARHTRRTHTQRERFCWRRHLFLHNKFPCCATNSTGPTYLFEFAFRTASGTSLAWRAL